MKFYKLKGRLHSNKEIFCQLKGFKISPELNVIFCKSQTTMATASKNIVAEPNKDLKLNDDNYEVWNMKI